MKRQCSTCANYSPRFRGDFEGTCNLGGVFIESNFVCEKWEEGTYSFDFHVTAGSESTSSSTDQGTPADFGHA